MQSIEGVPKIKPGYNPAAWMLDITSLAEETRLGVDFADIYQRSNLFQSASHLFPPRNSESDLFFRLLTVVHSYNFRWNKDLVESLSKPSKNFKELKFSTKYNQSYFEQFIACLWKQNLSYWRNPQYTAVRFFYTVVISLMLGTICWRFGAKRYFH